MAIPNPFEKGAKAVKKVPPKVAIIAVGGGVVIYLVFRSSRNNAADASASAGEMQVVDDAASFQGSPAYADTLPGVYPVGGGQGALPSVDWGLPIAQDGAPAVDDQVTDVGDPNGVAQNGSGTFTLNIVAKNAGALDSPSTVKKTKAVAPKRGFHPGHSKGHEYYLPGVGWVSKARYDAATKRKPKAGGGAPKRQHPSKVHAAPKRSPKRASPPAHIENAPTSHTPARAPEPGKRPKQRVAQPKKRKRVSKPKKVRMFANPNRPNNRRRKKVKH